jgi:NO-binding membrane sensor protein with MHYT domain
MNSSSAILPGSYDYRMVACSILIAVAASYAAFDLAGRVHAYRGWARLSWLIGGATATGIGAWSMHYIGMLAFRLPVPVQYHGRRQPMPSNQLLAQFPESPSAM